MNFGKKNHELKILIILTVLFLGACSPKQYTSRYSYNFEKKQLLAKEPIPGKKTEKGETPDSATVVQKSPLVFPSGKDIQIEVKNFNPLTTEVSILDSSSRYFFSDTSKLSKAIGTKIGILPVPQTTTPAGAISTAAKDKNANDCGQLKKFGDAYASENKETQKQMDILTKMTPLFNGIKDSYNDLSKAPSISTASVKKSIQDNFLIQFNSYLVTNKLKPLNDDPLKVSMADLQKVIDDVFKKISTELSQEHLDGIAKLDLKKCVKDKDQLIKSLNETINAVNEYRKAYESKTFPEIKTRLIMYGSLEFYLRNEPNYVSRHIPIEKDEHNIKINSKNVSTNITSNWDIIRVLPNRGFKLDVAAGFFVSGLHDENYTRQSKDSILNSKYVQNGVVRDTTKLQTFNGFFKQDQNQLSFGASIYLHAHTQTASNFNWGASLGFGTLFNDQARMVFSFGPTLIIGKKQRFTINPSVACAQTDRLSKPYRDGVWYEKNIDNVPYFKAWKVDWSLGFSWNL